MLHLACAALMISWPTLATAQLHINEFMASNDTTIEDPDEPGAYEDWIELYNAGVATVDFWGHVPDRRSC